MHRYREQARSHKEIEEPSEKLIERSNRQSEKE
jgi:hypothetical protein